MEQSTIAIIIVIIAIILMVTEIIPLAATIMLAAIAMSIAGIQELTVSHEAFGSTTVVFLVGMMIIGNGLFETGVAQSMGKYLFRTKVAQNERALIVAIVLIAGILSAFTSNSAVVAMMMPLIASVAYKSGGTIKQKNVLMALGVAAAVGGGITLSGSTSQLVAQGILETTEGVRTMTYFEMGKVALPLLLITAVYFGTIGYSIEKKVFNFEEEIDTEIIPDENQEFVPWKKWMCGIVTILVLLGFIFNVWNIGFVALVGATVLLATKCLDYKKALKGVDWNTVIILGGAQAMAAGLDSSGAGAMIANGILGLCGGENASAFVIMAAMAAITLVLTNLMSNTACVAMMTPIAISVSAAMGTDALSLIIPMVIASQCAVATPIGTPCMTQVLVGGYRFKDYLKVGVPLAVILTVMIIVLSPIMYGL